VSGSRWNRNSHHPFGHPLQRLVLGIEGFDCRIPLVEPTLVGVTELFLAVDLGSQSGVPGDLPPTFAAVFSFRPLPIA